MTLTLLLAPIFIAITSLQFFHLIPFKKDIWKDKNQKYATITLSVLTLLLSTLLFPTKNIGHAVATTTFCLIGSHIYLYLTNRVLNLLKIPNDFPVFTLALMWIFTLAFDYVYA